MEDPRSGESHRPEEQKNYNGPPGEQENDSEAIANRVVDVFWESLQDKKEDTS